MASNSNRLRIIIEGVNKSGAAFKSAEIDIKKLDTAAGQLSKGLKGLAAAGGIAGALQLAQAAFGLAQAGAESARLRTSFESLASQAGTTGSAMLSSLRGAARGAISDSDLMLAANRASLLGVADTAEELAGLLEVASARGAALGLSTQQAFSDIVTGIGRQSPLILDNLGIIVDLDAAYDTYAATLGKTASQLTELEQKQAVTNQVVANSKQLVADNAAAGEAAVVTFERFTASVTNLQEALGRLLTAGGGGGVVGILADIAQGTATGIDALLGDESAIASRAAATQVSIQTVKNEIMQLRAAREGATASERIAIEAQIKYLQVLLLTTDATLSASQAQAVQNAALDSADTALRNNVAGSLDAADAAGTFGTAVTNMAGALASADRAMRNSASVVQQTADAYVQSAVAIDSAISGITNSIFRQAGGAASIIGSEAALRIANEQAAAIERQAAAWKAAGLSQEEITFRTAELTAETSKVWQDIRGADRAAQKMATGGVRQVSDGVSEIQGKVAGILSGAIGPVAGIDANDLLPREDAINEDARRLADVAVRGYESPWAEYLSNKFPDTLGAAFAGGDIRGAAARALRDFQDGLRPELLDKEKAKERVRRMLTGEQNLAALAKEIATELAQEFGTAAGPQFQQQVNSALGIAGGTAQPVEIVPDLSALQSGIAASFNAQLGAGGADVSGEQAGGAFSGGLLGALAGVGTRAMQALDIELRSDANISLLTKAGENAGTKWGDGFLKTVGDNVPDKLIKILVNLVTPGVEERTRQNASLVGAN